ncbi:MAG: hypothetical protein KC586_25455, partial [Myxococcales bacterium]|nr:hypothetical protein [Myxococcales bacterium]
MDTLRFGSSPPPPSDPTRRWDKREDSLVGGEYRVLRRIGKGSGGAVYEARHELSGQQVAVKILHDR